MPTDGALPYLDSYVLYLLYLVRSYLDILLDSAQPACPTTSPFGADLAYHTTDSSSIIIAAAFVQLPYAYAYGSCMHHLALSRLPAQAFAP